MLWPKTISSLCSYEDLFSAYIAFFILQLDLVIIEAIINNKIVSYFYLIVKKTVNVKKKVVNSNEETS